MFLLFSFRRFEGDSILANQLRGSLQPGDLVLLEQELDAFRVLLAHGAGTLHGDAVFELDVASSDPEFLGVLQSARDRRRLEERLGGNATPKHAGPA